MPDTKLLGSIEPELGDIVTTIDEQRYDVIPCDGRAIEVPETIAGIIDPVHIVRGLLRVPDLGGYPYVMVVGVKEIIEE